VSDQFPEKFTKFMNRTVVTKSHYLVLLGIILCALALRAIYLSQPMRYDESLTFLRYASQPLGTVIASYEEPNNHILHSVLVHVAYRLLGDEPWVLRLPAFIAGVLLIPALYVVTRRFYMPRAGLLAAALCAVSLPLVEFSVNARGYTLLALIVVLLLGVAQWVREHSTVAGWLAFCVLTALGFYTIPVMVYPFGIVALWLLLSYTREFRGSELLKRLFVMGIAVAAAGLLTLLLYSPVIARAGIGGLTQNEFVARPAASEFYQRLPEILRVLVEFPNLGFPWWMALALLGGFALATGLHRRLSSVRFSPAWALLLWLVAALFFMRVIPFDRTWTVITPFYLMLAAVGITYIFGRSEKWFTFALLLLTVPAAFGLIQSGAVTASERTGIAPDAEDAALWLGQRLQPDDVVLAPTPLDEPLRYYLHLHGYSMDVVHNQYDTYWIDLLQADVGEVYVFGLPEGDLSGLLQTFNLPRPAVAATLQTAQTFPQMILQEMALPAYPEGVLYEDDFEAQALFPGWLLNNVDARLVKDGDGNQVLSLSAGDQSGEMLLSGAQSWRDYAVELRVRVVVPSSDSEDVYLYVRSTPRVSSYAAGFDVGEARAYIAGDAHEQWRGFLAETPMPFEPETWYTLRFAADGENVSLSINGEAAAQITDSVAQQGSIRFLFPAHSQIELDNMQVTRLDG
jgi:hypothetical protein